MQLFSALCFAGSMGLHSGHCPVHLHHMRRHGFYMQLKLVDTQSNSKKQPHM